MTAQSPRLEREAQAVDARRKPVLDPTLGYQDFAQKDDHAAWGHLKARAAWDTYKHSCERLQREDPTAYARAEVAGYEARIAEGLRELRIHVRLFRKTGDRVLYKENGIEFEKTAIRLWVGRLEAANENLEAMKDPAE